MRFTYCSPLFSRLCLLLALCFVWSFAVAPCAIAASASRKVAPVSQSVLRRFASPAQRLANTSYYGLFRRLPAPDAVAGSLSRATHSASPSLSLLDETGRPVRPVTPALAAAWRQELTTTHPPLTRVATLHLWLGEYALAHDEQPDIARRHFRTAEHLTGPHTSLHGAAAYDSAVSLYDEGAYRDAADSFQTLLRPQTAPVGYDMRACALWLRHAGACAGLHETNSRLYNIPEPTRLDPLCGVAALAASLRSLGLPSDRRTVRAACRVTGEGSNLQDIEDAGCRLGVRVRAVTADDRGLRLLPKPLIAHVESDHFISVVGTSSHGVAYLCSDCGPFPGGRVDLTWAQWRRLGADVYGVVTKPGSAWDRDLTAALSAPAAGSFRVASAGPLVGLGRRAVLMNVPPAALLRRHVFDRITSGTYSTCDRSNTSLHCHFPLATPMDTPAVAASGSSAGDPVNLATGEEEYQPAPDLVVYNPHGPNVVWQRSYASLLTQQDLVGNFGDGWSDTYNVSVSEDKFNNSYSLQLSNGGAIAFTQPNGDPTAGHPIICSVSPGNPLLIEFDYDATDGYYYTVTFPDRTKWVLGNANPGNSYGLNKIIDRNGNGLAFSYGSNYTISDLNSGVALLTVSFDDNGNLVSASDAYGRSVYYHLSQYGHSQYGTPYSYEVDQVSQMVPTGTLTAGAAIPSQYLRYSYGYTSTYGTPPNTHTVGDGAAFLGTITVPSPTGSGSSTTTLSYDANQLVSKIVDANGNTHSYDYSQANATKVTVSNPQAQPVYAYTAGFDPNMTETSRTDGAGNPVYTVNSFDANDPYRPSSVTDGNGRTTQMTWDSYGNLLTETPLANANRTPATTTNTYDYTKFALGELTQVQEGSKAPTKYTYDDQPVTGGWKGSGLPLSSQGPLPGSPGTLNPTPTTYTYDLTTYDNNGNVTHQGLGSPLTVTTPGNNAATTITTTLGYTTDGGYSQAAAIGQPLTVTDNLGKVTHLRYDSRGNCLSVTDALGNETDATFNIADQELQTTFPATGQQGAGRSNVLNAYLYPDGPLTGITTSDESGTAIRQVNYTYGNEGETLSISGSTEPATYTYDALYRLSTLADGNGNATHYYYKQQGYLDAVTYPGYTGPAPVYNSSTDDYSNVTGKDSLRFPAYDLDGNTLTRIDGNGTETDYTHNTDPESLLTSVRYSDRQTGDVSYNYDQYGRRSGMTDGTGSQSYTYDDLDALLNQNTTYTGLPAKTISDTYYPDGSRQTMDTPAGSFSYTYDAVGRMTGLTNPYSEATTWQYQSNGWLSSQQAKNASAQNIAIAGYSYNALGEVTQLSNTGAPQGVMSVFGYQTPMTYDGVGNRLSLNRELGTDFGGTTNFTYDYGQTANPALNRSQLTQETSTIGSGYTNNFAYDGGVGSGAGNPTTFRGMSHSFNSNNQDTGSTYDGNGNLKYGSVAAYDAENRLIGFSSSVSIKYTGDSLQGLKENSSAETLFLYDDDHPVVELDQYGNVTAVNTFGANGLVSRHTASGSTFYAFNPSGNVAERVDSDGNVTSADTYDAFGARHSTSSGQPDPYGFGGQWGYYDDFDNGSDPGFILCTHRFYDPSTGRWLTRDPLGYAGGVNLYGYVGNDPVNFADPEGLSWYSGGWGKGLLCFLVGAQLCNSLIPKRPIEPPSRVEIGNPDPAPRAGEPLPPEPVPTPEPPGYTCPSGVGGSGQSPPPFPSPGPKPRPILPTCGFVCWAGILAGAAGGSIIDPIPIYCLVCDPNGVNQRFRGQPINQL